MCNYKLSIARYRESAAQITKQKKKAEDNNHKGQEYKTYQFLFSHTKDVSAKERAEDAEQKMREKNERKRRRRKFLDSLSPRTTAMDVAAHRKKKRLNSFLSLLPLETDFIG